MRQLRSLPDYQIMIAASLGFTICYVDDVEAVLHRFESAFSFKRRMLTEDGRYGELETGGTVWAFADREFGRDHFTDPKVRAAFDGEPTCVEFVLLTHDVPAVYANALSAGLVSVAPPTVREWGQTLAWVQDRTGILIELSTPA